MKRTYVLIGLTIALTACQSAVTPPGASMPTTAPAASSSPSATPAPAVTQAPTAAPAPTTPPLAYKMNKNYDIVPIDADGNKKVVLLTFDDGPKDIETLEPLLDALDKHNAKAIFFVNGYRVKQKPELLKLIQQRGQIIGNHSWDHIDLKKETVDKIDRQIGDVSDIVKEITGSAPRFFRPPYGSSNDHVKMRAKQEGMLFMTWSNGSLDWDLPSKLDDSAKSAAIIDNVLKQLHPGSNILMHELPWTAKTIDALLTKLEEQGYGFVDPQTIDTSM